jgi:phage gp45-like
VLALGVFDFGTDDEVVELDPPLSSDGTTVVVAIGNSSGVSVVTVEPRGSRTTGMSALESQIVWNSNGSPCWLTMNPSIVGGSV